MFLSFVVTPQTKGSKVLVVGLEDYFFLGGVGEERECDMQMFNSKLRRHRVSYFGNLWVICKILDHYKLTKYGIIR